MDNIKSLNLNIKLPAVSIGILYNKVNTNVLTSSKEGTYIKSNNVEKLFKHHNNIKLSKTFTDKKEVYFLRKGSGKKLVKYVLKDLKENGIKTVFIHPLNKSLQEYYKDIGFIAIPKVPLNRGFYYESYNYGQLMYMEL